MFYTQSLRCTALPKKRLNTTSNVKDSLGVVESTTYICVNCGNIFLESFQLAIHMWEAHNEHSTHCGFCGTIFHIPRNKFSVRLQDVNVIRKTESSESSDTSLRKSSFFSESLCDNRPIKCGERKYFLISMANEFKTEDNSAVPAENCSVTRETPCKKIMNLFTRNKICWVEDSVKDKSKDSCVSTLKSLLPRTTLVIDKYIQNNVMYNNGKKKVPYFTRNSNIVSNENTLVISENQSHLIDTTETPYAPLGILSHIESNTGKTCLVSNSQLTSESNLNSCGPSENILSTEKKTEKTCGPSENKLSTERKMEKPCGLSENELSTERKMEKPCGLSENELSTERKMEKSCGPSENKLPTERKMEKPCGPSENKLCTENKMEKPCGPSENILSAESKIKKPCGPSENILLAESKIKKPCDPSENILSTESKIEKPGGPSENTLSTRSNLDFLKEYKIFLSSSQSNINKPCMPSETILSSKENIQDRDSNTLVSRKSLSLYHKNGMHSQKGQLICKLCKRWFDTYYYLERHSLIVHNIKCDKILNKTVDINTIQRENHSKFVTYDNVALNQLRDKTHEVDLSLSYQGNELVKTNDVNVSLDQRDGVVKTHEVDEVKKSKNVDVSLNDQDNEVVETQKVDVPLSYQEIEKNEIQEVDVPLSYQENELNETQEVDVPLSYQWNETQEVDVPLSCQNNEMNETPEVDVPLSYQENEMNKTQEVDVPLSYQQNEMNETQEVDVPISYQKNEMNETQEVDVPLSYQENEMNETQKVDVPLSYQENEMNETQKFDVPLSYQEIEMDEIQEVDVPLSYQENEMNATHEVDVPLSYQDNEMNETQEVDVPISYQENEMKETQEVDVPISYQKNEMNETQEVDVPLSYQKNEINETQVVDVPLSYQKNEINETQEVDVPLSYQKNEINETQEVDVCCSDKEDAGEKTKKVDVCYSDQKDEVEKTKKVDVSLNVQENEVVETQEINVCLSDPEDEFKKSKKVDVYFNDQEVEVNKVQKVCVSLCDQENEVNKIKKVDASFHGHSDEIDSNFVRERNKTLTDDFEVNIESDKLLIESNYHRELTFFTDPSVNNYPCSTCKNVFPTRYSFRIHNKSCICCVCTHCGDEFWTKSTLSRHMALHTKDKGDNLTQKAGRDDNHSTQKTGGGENHSNKKAQKISKSVSTQPIYIKESNRKEINVKFSMHPDTRKENVLDLSPYAHSSKKTHKCSWCGNLYSTRYNLSRHRTFCKEAPKYLCAFCGNAFLNKTLLSKHKAEVHPDEVRTLEKSVEKAKITVNNSTSYFCKDCGQTFKLPRNFAEHLNVHVIAGVYACSGCKKRFRTRQLLMFHINTVHKKIKPYTCQICAMTFTYSGALNAHINAHWSKSLYSCDKCDRTYKHLRSLSFHKRTHAKNHLKVVCVHCNKSFMKKQHLEIHMLTHVGGKVNTCNSCGKTLGYKSSLKKHHQQVHLNPNFFCDICGCGFKNKRDLIGHLNKH